MTFMHEVCIHYFGATEQLRPFSSVNSQQCQNLHNKMRDLFEYIMRNRAFFRCILFSLQLRKLIVNKITGLRITRKYYFSLSTCCLPFLCNLSENVFRVNPTSIFFSEHFLLDKLKNSSPENVISVIIFCFYSPDVILNLHDFPLWSVK